MQQFPLYDNIVKNLSIDLKFDSVEICQIINKISDENQELICAIIHHYSLLNKITKTKKNGLLYGGKTMSENKTGCLWIFDSLPAELQRIIAKFVLYLKQKLPQN